MRMDASLRSCCALSVACGIELGRITPCKLWRSVLCRIAGDDDGASCASMLGSHAAQRHTSVDLSSLNLSCGIDLPATTLPTPTCRREQTAYALHGTRRRSAPALAPAGTGLSGIGRRLSHVLARQLHRSLLASLSFNRAPCWEKCGDVMRRRRRWQSCHASGCSIFLVCVYANAHKRQGMRAHMKHLGVRTRQALRIA